MESFDIENFISAVEEKTLLWDKTEEDFKDRNKTKAAWEEIFVNFITNYEGLANHEKNVKGKALMNKWANMRDSWVKNHKSMKSIKSGEAYRKRRKYVFYEQLSFLAKTTEHNVTVSNITPEDTVAEPDVEEIEEDLQTFDIETQESVPTTSKKQGLKRTGTGHKKSNKDPFEAKLLNILEKAALPVPVENEDKSFLNSILPTIEKFDEDQKLQFRIEVLQLLQKIKRFKQSSAPTATQNLQFNNDNIGHHSSESSNYQEYSEASCAPIYYSPNFQQIAASSDQRSNEATAVRDINSTVNTYINI